MGNIIRSIDIWAKKEYNYIYDESRLVRASENTITLNGEMVTGRTVVNTVRYKYNSDGQMTSKVITPVGGTPFTYYYSNSDNGTSVQFTVGGRTVTSHSKTDSFGRKTFDELQLGTGFVTRQFTYHAGQVTDEHRDNEKLKSTATTQLVSQIVLSDGRTLSYEYDAEERITKVVDSFEGITEYTYDALGQLLTEAVNGEVVNLMEYDNYGNILSKNGVAYSYCDCAWKDMLTAVGDDAIEYDAQGNPVKYFGHTLSWEKGRQLKSFDNITYTYNANGIRTSKTVNGVKHTYTLDGTNILRETWGSNTLIPLYDNEESVCGIVYNDTSYYFLKNLQGDIIAIANKNGDTVARYSYDAWGKCTITSDCCGIASINPYRYRGYYYDVETSLYYLQSRYYDANVERFISSDYADVTTCVTVLHSHNLFCYACNSPVNETDANGNLAAKAIAKFVLWAVFGVFAQFISDVIEFLYRKFIQKKNSSFTLSPLGDYLGSAISWGMCSFDLFNNKLVAFFAPFIPVLVKHVTNIIRDSFSWQALLVDLASAFIAGIISVALNQSMKNKLSKVKRGKGNSYSDYARYLKKQQKITFNINKKFLKVSISIVISTSLMQLLLNLLLK